MILADPELLADLAVAGMMADSVRVSLRAETGNRRFAERPAGADYLRTMRSEFQSRALGVRTRA
jgi:hypothetical protein